MDPRHLDPPAQSLLQEMLGYLNFSSGTPDVRFRQNMNELMRRAATESPDDQPWEIVRDLLTHKLQELANSSDAFRQAEQAQAVIALAFDRLPAAYREFHHDLLHHQTDAALLQPFFLARCCEALLQQGLPWDETERLIAGVSRR